MIRLLVRKLAPFDDAEHAAVWFGDSAAVWYWSRSRVGKAAGGLETSSRHRGWLPESLFLGGRPDKDGLERLTTPTGVYGRAWRDGALVADRWWSEQPNSADWSAFARGAGFASHADDPKHQAVTLSDTPWTQTLSLRRRWPAAQSENVLRAAWLVVGFLSLGLICFELGALTRASMATSSMTAERATLDEPLQRILSARQSAEQNITDIQAIQALSPNLNQAALLDEFQQRMPAMAWTLTRWQLSEAGRLNVALSAPSANVEAIVAALEESPRFQDVQSNVAGASDELVIDLGIEPPASARP